MTAHAVSLAVRSLLRRQTLTAERERQLLRAHRDGDEAARRLALSELWESHSRLVVAVARQYRHPDVAMTDLIGAGHLGMHAAIEGFDPDHAETRLSNYAVGWIHHYIHDYIRRRTAATDAGELASHRQLALTAGRLFADARRACHREGVDPSDAELHARVGARLGLSSQEVADHFGKAHGGAPGPGAPVARLETMPPPAEAVVLHFDHAKLRRRVLALAEEILGGRERKVFLARCMTGEEGTRQRDALAQSLGVTRERIYQLEVSAKRKVAAALAHDGMLDQARQHEEPAKPRVARRHVRRPAEAPV